MKECAAQLANSSDVGFSDEVFRTATSGAEEFETTCGGIGNPRRFASTWTTKILLKKSEGPIFEYACHEGNRGLPKILSVARAQERAAAEAVQDGSR